MGNTVSAAERMAEHIVHPVSEPVAAHNKQQNVDYSGVPPPECPMHQADAPKMKAVAVSECPQGYGKDEINPLNMVIMILS